jgi:hypothetical protein
MWFRVDDGFLRHSKVHSAADTLGGRNPLGRIAAVWLECGLYAAGALSDGFVPNREIARLATDERPQDVIRALVAAGLVTETGAGITFHDWTHYQPPAAKVKEKRAKDRARKAERHSTPTLRGIHSEGATDSARNPHGTNDGNAAESIAIPERSRARDPVPSPEDQNHKEQRADARASHRVLVRLAHDVLADVEAGTVASLDLSSELKTRAAQARIAYDSESVRKALDSAETQRSRPARSA